MKPTITVNQYPIGWEWLDRVPLEDFNWLIEIFAILTDNTDTYNFVGYTDSETLPGGHQKICSVDKIPSPQAYPPNKQNKVYHLTANNTNPIHLITNPTHRNDLASNPK